MKGINIYDVSTINCKKYWVRHWWIKLISSGNVIERCFCSRISFFQLHLCQQLLAIQTKRFNYFQLLLFQKKLMFRHSNLINFWIVAWITLVLFEKLCSIVVHWNFLRLDRGKDRESFNHSRLNYFKKFMMPWNWWEMKWCMYSYFLNGLTSNEKLFW